MLALILILLAGPQADMPTAADAGRASSRVQELPGPFRDETGIRSAFDTELKSPAYKRLRQRLRRLEAGEPPNVQMPNWWNRFWTWFGNLFSRRAPGGGQTGGLTFGGIGGGTLLAWILFGLLLVILVAFIIRSAAVKISDKSEKQRLRRELDTDRLEPTTPPGEIPSDEYMRRALELAHDGDHRRALRQLVLGGMSWIERAGLIRFRKGLTNRDYLRAVYRREEQRQRFAGIVLDFERVYFGRRSATAEQFDECLDQYQNAFARELPPGPEIAAATAAAPATKPEARPDRVSVPGPSTKPSTSAAAPEPEQPDLPSDQQPDQGS